MSSDETIGNYRLLGELGRGGMGIIYKAEQMSLGRFVALKVLYPHLINDPLTVKRFNHEARATALLNHPNIVQIFDVGVEEDMHFFAMEYVPGKDLEAVLENRGKLGVEETLRIADQAAAALSAASDVGIIHRDVKPSNILIDDRGIIKVSDFGIAVAAGQGDLTDTGHLMGSVRYMSPEHARVEHLDSRSDLYALGIVMYEMLTGHVPFDGDFPLEVLKKHEETPPPPMPETIPPGVQALVLKCLEKRRVDRPRTLRAFRRELRDCVADLDWQGPALPQLETVEPVPQLEPDPTFRYDRAGVVRSVTDTLSFCLSERLRPRKGVLGRLGRRIAERLGRRVRHRHDSYKLKRLEVMELRENLRRAEMQLEEAKLSCDRAHEKYEVADEELHGWQMEGSLSVGGGNKFNRESAAIQEKKLWQQLTSYKLQWHSLQDRVRDWYQNVERARRDYETTVRELDLLRLRRRHVAEQTGVLRRNWLRLVTTVVLVVTVVVLGTLYGDRLWSGGDAPAARDGKSLRDASTPRGPLVYGAFLNEVFVMTTERDEHAAALLSDDTVIVTGGIDASRTVLKTVEVFDARTRTFVEAGELDEARCNHTMTTLPGGAGVVIIGGERTWGGRDATASVELLMLVGKNVAGAGKVGELSVPRTRHRSVLLADGTVLVTGGSNTQGRPLDSAEIVDPRTYRAQPIVARMGSARRDHTVTRMPDGRVVIVGGGLAGHRPIAGVEVYDPVAKTFETVCALEVARYEHSAVALDDHRLLVIGGRKGQYAADALDTIELLDLVEKRSYVVTRLRRPRGVHTAVALPGSVPKTALIVGGGVGTAGEGTNLCERYAVEWTETKNAGLITHDRNNHTATLIPLDGSILITGGHGRNARQPLRTAELYVKVHVE